MAPAGAKVGGAAVNLRGLMSAMSIVFPIFRELVRRRSSGPSRLRLCVTALRLGVKYVILIRLLKRKVTHERLLGLTVEAGRYTEILLLFIEIFLRQEYRFESASQAPRIIDCGGNIGFATLFFKSMFPKARITTIEPSPASFEVLERNLKANGMTDVDARRLAVSGKRGTLDFYIDPAQPTSARSSTKRERGGQQLLQVEAVPLSELIDEPIDYLKLDIEGAEMEVIPELARSGKLQMIRELAIEYHHHMTAGDDQLSRMLAILESQGFGYNLHTPGELPGPDRFQDIMIYAYRRATVAKPSPEVVVVHAHEALGQPAR